MARARKRTRQCALPVTAVNADLSDYPEVVNSKPHDTWMITLKLGDPSEAEGLLDSAGYQASLG